MTVYLLKFNVLIALVDPAHTMHRNWHLGPPSSFGRLRYVANQVTGYGIATLVAVLLHASWCEPRLT